MEAAITAQEIGDYATAARFARSAWMRVGGLPDSELQDERLTWKPDSIERIVKDLELHANAQSGSSDNSGHGALFRTTEIEYRRG